MTCAGRRTLAHCRALSTDGHVNVDIEHVIAMLQGAEQLPETPPPRSARAPLRASNTSASPARRRRRSRSRSRSRSRGRKSTPVAAASDPYGYRASQDKTDVSTGRARRSQSGTPERHRCASAISASQPGSTTLVTLRVDCCAGEARSAAVSRAPVASARVATPRLSVVNIPRIRKRLRRRSRSRRLRRTRCLTSRSEAVGRSASPSARCAPNTLGSAGHA